jgi:hypothetical protein
MTNTRLTQAEAFEHLLKTVLGWNDLTPAFVSIIQNCRTTITADSFADFCSNVAPKLIHGVPDHVTTSQSLNSVSSSAIMTPSHVDSFDALQHHDIKDYVKFNGKGKFYPVRITADY